MEWGVESGMSGEEVLEVTLKQKRSRSSHTTRRLSAFHGLEGRQKQKPGLPLSQGELPVESHLYAQPVITTLHFGAPVESVIPFSAFSILSS